MPATAISSAGACLNEPALCAPGSPMEDVLRLARAMARRDCPVLVSGESGTGKEVLAQFLHRHSLRAEQPFGAVNCAAMSSGLVESELFGHRRGAFTGALSDRPGRIRQADGGTLFLDEIGDMPLELQARLLRVLQEKTVCPVGGDVEIPVDFRLICATHRDLAAEVRAGRFREDLYYRLRVLELRLPPLRDRPMDIPFLLGGFLTPLVGRGEAIKAVETLPSIVLRHRFPGNVRELRNLAERYAALRDVDGGWERVLDADVPSPSCPVGVPNRTVRDSNRLRNSRLSTGDILSALEACGYHRSRAAAKLGVSRRALQYRLAGMQACPQ